MELVEFEDAFDNIVETSEMEVIVHALLPVLETLAETACIAIDTNCFTLPYQPATVDMAGLSIYNHILKRGLSTCLLSWMPDDPTNVSTETARLTALGVDPTTLLLRAVDFPKKTLAWDAAIAAYTRDRVPREVAMYIGRYWVDVLPPDIVNTAMPSTAVGHHLLCRHIATNTWSLRISPDFKLVDLSS